MASTSTQHDHRRQQQPEGTSSQLRLKCIVLGSAGAGKTCLVRRYIHGTFEGGHHFLYPGNNDRSNNNRVQNHHRRTRVRSTTSTLGADYYVKKVDLMPNSRNNSHADGKTPAVMTDNVESSHHVLVQLWDTAGKERLKPQRHHPAQYDKQSIFYQFLSIKPSSASVNNNNSNYEHRYNNWGFLNGIVGQEEEDNRTTTSNNEKNNTTTNMHNCHHDEQQKGKVYNRHHNNNAHDINKHGRPLHYHNHNNVNIKYSQQQQINYNTSNNNEPMGDALFRNIDACMLVYDSTSSMSFLHLMQWHSEWVQRLNHWEREETENDNAERNTSRSTRRRRKIPFIVVANKLDLLENRERHNSQQTKIHYSSVGQKKKRRSVMGFRDGEYKGKELKYEYAAENATTQHHEQRYDTNATTTAPTATTAVDNNRLTYSLKDTLWSTDATYLNALQLTEDQLPANRLMILLWCQRNGIPHVEASALDGRGVEEAMEHLVKIGVEELGMRQGEKPKEEQSLRERRDCERGGNNKPDVSSSEKEKEFNRRAHQQSCAPENTILGTSTQDTDNGNSTHENGTSVNNNYVAIGHASDVTNTSVDPSQYYFLYQPRQEEKLDLFARYSPKDEPRCSPFKCLMPFLSYCRR